MESYQYVKFLGQGSYGEVQLVKHIVEEKEYVLKKIGLQRASFKERFAAEQEAAMLSQLRHINIVSYKHSFQMNGCLHIIMQYCEGGDLHTWLSTRKGAHVEELKIILWFVQIALALQYLHGKNILHRDLKTQNIFLTHKNEIIKLGDLGIARQLSGTQDMAKTIIGTPYYMSPELFSNRPYNFKSDVWSLGCVVYEMCTMKHAFRARDFSGLAYKICTGKVPPLPEHYSTELGSLMSSMLEQEPEDRPTVSDILHQKFIRAYIQIFIKRNRVSSGKGKGTKDTPKQRNSNSNSSNPDIPTKLENSLKAENPLPPEKPTKPDNSTEPVNPSVPENHSKHGLLGKPASPSLPPRHESRNVPEHYPHIRNQSKRNTSDRLSKQDSEENDVACKPSSKRLSNSNHLSLIPSVVDLLKNDESKASENVESAFTRVDSKRRMSKEKFEEPVIPVVSQISNARKRRIEDKRKRSRSSDRTSPDPFSSSSSGSPSPTLDITEGKGICQNVGGMSQDEKVKASYSASSRPQSPNLSSRPPSPSSRPPSPSSRPPSPSQRPPSPSQRPPSPIQRPPSPSQRPPSPNQRPPSPVQKVPNPNQRPPRPSQRTSSPCRRSPSPCNRPGSPSGAIISDKASLGNERSNRSANSAQPFRRPDSPTAVEKEKTPSMRPDSPIQQTPQVPVRSNSPSLSARSENPVPGSYKTNNSAVLLPGTPASPQVRRKSTVKSSAPTGPFKSRPLPPTPRSVRMERRTKSLSEDVKLVDFVESALSTAEKDTLNSSEICLAADETSLIEPDGADVGTRERIFSGSQKNPLPDQDETQPQVSRLRSRLEKLRDQVLPCVSRDVLEKAYRVLDESDPDKVQGELMLLLGNSKVGLCNKVMELYICEQRLLKKNSLFQSI